MFTPLAYLERRLTFKPDSLDHGALRSFAFERATIGHEFGLELDAVFVRGSSERVVLFIHGNRYNLTKFGTHYQFFISQGLSFLAFDYPGYGLSAGIPSEEAMYMSARAAYSYLRAHRGWQPEQIVAYGLSLGGAVATELATHQEIRKLVLESTFTSSRQISRHLYPYLPLWWYYPERFNNAQRIATIKVPIFLLHGRADSTIPPCMSEELYQRAPGEKLLRIIDGAHHRNCLEVAGEDFLGELGAFIAG